jgi:hypothetical protein
MTGTFYQNAFHKFRLAWVLQPDLFRGQEDHGVVSLKYCGCFYVSRHCVIGDSDTVDLHAEVDGDSFGFQIARDAENTPASETMADENHLWCAF